MNEDYPRFANDTPQVVGRNRHTNEKCSTNLCLCAYCDQRSGRDATIKGQLGVPLTVYPWYLLCSLGILGDYNS